MATLTRDEAHEVVDAAAQMGALSHLAAHWDLAGWWNQHATWTAEEFHQHVDDEADDLRGSFDSATRKDSDATGLAAWNGVL